MFSRIIRPSIRHNIRKLSRSFKSESEPDHNYLHCFVFSSCLIGGCIGGCFGMVNGVILVWSGNKDPIYSRFPSAIFIGCGGAFIYGFCGTIVGMGVPIMAILAVPTGIIICGYELIEKSHSKKK